MLSDTINNDMARTAPWLKTCEQESDDAVRAINRRHGQPEYGLELRVPFPEWCAELGVERGA
jgi:hypothetical protein